MGVLSIVFVLVILGVLLAAFGGEGGRMGLIRGVYVLAMGALLVMLVAFGVSTFYPSPKSLVESVPYPVIRVPPPPPGPGQEATPEYQEWQKEQQRYSEESKKRWEEQQQVNKGYHQKVLFLAYPWGLLFIFVGPLRRFIRANIVRAGFLLGGVGTMVYAVAQGGGDLSNGVRFVATGVGLVVLIYLGYRELEMRAIRANGDEGRASEEL